jgi:hypothetical protein
MKKLILGMVFAFATGTIMNANIYNNTQPDDDCFQDAWDYGTENGNGNETLDWFWTNVYYQIVCEGKKLGELD